jgi:hypothetical protein
MTEDEILAAADAIRARRQRREEATKELAALKRWLAACGDEPKTVRLQWSVWDEDAVVVPASVVLTLLVPALEQWLGAEAEKL